MNTYHLITRDQVHYYVKARYAHDAVNHVQVLTRQWVSCWFIATSLPLNATVLTANL